MNIAQSPTLVADSTTQDEETLLRLNGHVRSATLVSLGTLAVAGLLLWLIMAGIPTRRLLAWLLALGLVVCWRQWLHWQQCHATDASPAVGLRRFRMLAVVHGLVWGLAAWLPLLLADPQWQAAIVVVLLGLVVGAIAQTLFDLRAVLLFTLAMLCPLVLRLATIDGPLAPATLVASVAAVALLLPIVLASRKIDRERLALLATRRAEQRSTQGAREAQVLLGQVFDHAGQGISVFNSSLHLVAWNQRLADLTGISPSLLRQGLPLADALHDLAKGGRVPPLPGSDNVMADVPVRLQALSQPVASVAHERWADGRLIETRRNPLPDGGFVMFLADITEREATRRAAAEQQRMLALVLHRTEEGFWSIDNNLCTTDANPAMCRMLGLTRGEVLGRSIYTFVDADNRAIFERNVAMRAAGEAGSYEISLLRADGSQVHCLNSATPVFDTAGRKTGALGLFSDISAQRAAALQIRLAGEALAQKTNVLAWTLDSLVQGVLNVDPQGHCTAWNKRFVDLLQLPPALMDSHPHLNEVLAWQLAHGNFGQKLELLDEAGKFSVQQALSGGRTNFGHHYRRLRTDGTVLDVASHFAVDGSLVRTYTDVTESVTAEAALVRARDVATRAQKEAEAANSAKSEFLSRMSHELRTPLNAILGFAQLLQADVADRPTPVQAQRLDALMRGGQHLLALIDDVLDVARIEAGNLQLALQAVGLPQLVSEALALVQPMAQARGVVLVAVPAGAAADWTVHADPTRLRQVLLNLLSNAIKFNRAAGEVRISLSEAGSQLRVEVADQGAGMRADQLSRLFQPFERLDMDGAVEGTGIGLALSRSLVSLMQGEIGVRSTPGQGSVFWLQLPQCTAAPHSVAVDDPAPVWVLPASRRDVLYIEDNPVNQLLMEGMLAHRPAISLRLASLPEAGVAMAVASPPDLVLLDIQLPGIDGFEVLRRLRQHPALQHTPVIAVSANAMPSDLAEAHAAGFSHYLTKPLDLKRLLDVVDSALAA